MTMHHALEIAEVLRLICDEARLSGIQGGLASLAQASSAFRETALDALWYEQTTLVNLLKLLPEGTWTWEEAPSPVHFRYTIHFISFTRRLTGDDLAMLLNITNLFPNLRLLVWRATLTNEYAIRFLVTLTRGPRLFSVSFPCPSNDADFASPLLGIAPRLQSFQICGFYPEATTSVSAANVVLSLRDIEALTISHIPRAAVLHLGRLRALQWLALRIPSDFGLLPERSMPFPDLRVLDLSVDDPKWHETLTRPIADPRIVPAFLRACHSLELESFVVHLRIEDADRADEIIETLGDRCSPQYLETLAITFVRHSLLPARPAPVVRPLLRFVHLRDVTLDLSGGIDVDDELLVDLAAAWPCIETLHLGPVDDAESIAYGHRDGPDELPPVPRASLRGLHAFAQRCLCLQTLTLSVDTTIPPPEDWPAEGLVWKAGPPRSS
ncbi:hypothetical protein MKEN_00634800 [Mycena kentingensis (nom. inval.)]|nr:hypothetical protein MKEN_00634800 [Mycena kentingensis (nom. inval.)]